MAAVTRLWGKHLMQRNSIKVLMDTIILFLPAARMPTQTHHQIKIITQRKLH